MVVSRLTSIVIAAAFAHISDASADTSYVLTELGAVPEDFIAFTGKGLDVNSKGWIAGARDVVHTDPTRTAQIGIPGDGVIETHATLGGTHSTANAINNNDYLTGLSETSSGEVHAFLWDGSTMTDLGTLGGPTSSGLAINSLGQVTGSSETTNGETNAVLWDDTGITDLGNLGGGFADGRAISNNGLVSGVATLPDGSIRAFLWDGNMHALDTLGGASAANAVNDHGQAAGSSELPDGTDVAAVWIGDEVISLGTLDGHNFSNAHSINNAGVVVGRSDSAGDDISAFVWDGQSMEKLPSPTQAEAWLITDDGVIFGITASIDAPRILRWDPAISVAIDIRLGNSRNKINPRANRKIWVAVVSGDSFDPLQIKIESVRFGPDEAPPIEHKVRDVNKDGIGDLLLRFSIREMGIECGDTDVILSGETYDQQLFSGTDIVETLGCK